jgi:hypothetical protein
MKNVVLGEIREIKNYVIFCILTDFGSSTSFEHRLKINFHA